MNVSKLNLILALTLAASACTQHDDKKTEPKPVALSLADFEHSSFGSLSWENHCVGIENFFIDFQKQYLPEATVSFDETSCLHPAIDRKSLSYNLHINFSRGEQTLQLYTYVYSSFDAEKQTFTQPNYQMTRILIGTPSITYSYAAEDAFLGENMLHLVKTFKTWLHVDDDDSAKVFGLSYKDFANKVAQLYGPGTEGLRAFNGVLLHLIQDKAQVGIGVVHFDEVAPSVFVRKNAEGKVVADKYLHCSDIGCLNNAPITYVLVGSTLSILSQPSNDPATLGQEYWSVTLRNSTP